MKIFFIVTTIISMSCAASLKEEALAKITQYESTSDGKGNYEFSFETSNGIGRRETGTLVNAGQPNEHIEVEGVVTYMGLDGKLVEIHYTAGDQGYQILLSPVPFVDTNRFGVVAPNVVASLLGK